MLSGVACRRTLAMSRWFSSNQFGHFISYMQKTPASGHGKTQPWLALRSGMLSAMLLNHVKGGPRCPANTAILAQCGPLSSGRDIDCGVTSTGATGISRISMLMETRTPRRKT